MILQIQIHKPVLSALLTWPGLLTTGTEYGQGHLAVQSNEWADRSPNCAPSSRWQNNKRNYAENHPADVQEKHLPALNLPNSCQTLEHDPRCSSLSGDHHHFQGCAGRLAAKFLPCALFYQILNDFPSLVLILT